MNYLNRIRSNFGNLTTAETSASGPVAGSQPGDAGASSSRNNGAPGMPASRSRPKPDFLTKFKINMRDNEGLTPLFRAVLEDDLMSAAQCLEQGAGPDVCSNQEGKYDRVRVTPLHLAAGENNARLLHLLLGSERCKINQPDGKGNTALHHAVNANARDAVDMLVHHTGLDLNKFNNGGITPLTIAVENNFGDMVRFLLKQPGIDPNSPRGYDAYAHPLVAATEIFRENSEIARALLAHPKIDASFTFPRSSNYSIEEMPPLSLLEHAATQYQDAPFVEALFSSKNRSVDKRMTPMLVDKMFFTKESDQNIVKALVAGFSALGCINEPHTGWRSRAGESILQTAIRLNYEQLVLLLLDAPGVDLDHQDAQGTTALRIALTCMQTSHPRGEKIDQWMFVVRKLISRGADVNRADHFGLTPLLHACHHSEIEVAELLLSSPHVKRSVLCDLLTNPDPDPGLRAGELRAMVLGLLRKRAPTPEPGHPVSSDEQFVIEELTQWAKSVPTDGTPDRNLTAKVNFKLGVLLKQSPQFAEARRSSEGKPLRECKNDAPFYFSIALEQRLQVDGGYTEKAQPFAAALLDATPTEKAFNIDGVMHLREDIQNMADGTGVYARLLREKKIPAQDEVGVHLPVVLSRGATMLDMMENVTAGSSISLEDARSAILALITAQPPKESSLNTDQIKLGFDRIFLPNIFGPVVAEGDLNTTVTKTLLTLHRYIESKPQPLKEQLQQSLLQQLYYLGEEDFCTTGIVQRLIDTLTRIDPATMDGAITPGASEIASIVESLESEILEQLKTSEEVLGEVKGTFQGWDGAGTEEKLSVRTELLRDLLKTTVNSRLIDQWDWDTPAVKAVLDQKLDRLQKGINYFKDEEALEAAKKAARLAKR